MDISSDTIDSSGQYSTELSPFVLHSLVYNYIINDECSSLQSLLDSKQGNMIPLNCPISPDINMTPLMLACDIGCMHCIHILVNHGASVSWTNSQGIDCLFIAINSGNFNIAIELIVRYNVYISPLHIDPVGNTILHCIFRQYFAINTTSPSPSSSSSSSSSNKQSNSIDATLPSVGEPSSSSSPQPLVFSYDTLEKLVRCVYARSYTSTGLLFNLDALNLHLESVLSIIQTQSTPSKKMLSRRLLYPLLYDYNNKTLYNIHIEPNYDCIISHNNNNNNNIDITSFSIDTLIQSILSKSIQYDYNANIIALDIYNLLIKLDNIERVNHFCPTHLKRIQFNHNMVWSNDDNNSQQHSSSNDHTDSQTPDNPPNDMTPISTDDDHSIPYGDDHVIAYDDDDADNYGSNDINTTFDHHHNDIDDDTHGQYNSTPLSYILSCCIKPGLHRRNILTYLCIDDASDQKYLCLSSTLYNDLLLKKNNIQDRLLYITNNDSTIITTPPTTANNNDINTLSPTPSVSIEYDQLLMQLQQIDTKIHDEIIYILKLQYRISIRYSIILLLCMLSFGMYAHRDEYGLTIIDYVSSTKNSGSVYHIILTQYITWALTKHEIVNVLDTSSAALATPPTLTTSHQLGQHLNSILPYTLPSPQLSSSSSSSSSSSYHQNDSHYNDLNNNNNNNNNNTIESPLERLLRLALWTTAIFNDTHKYTTICTIVRSLNHGPAGLGLNMARIILDVDSTTQNSSDHRNIRNQIHTDLAPDALASAVFIQSASSSSSLLLSSLSTSNDTIIQPSSHNDSVALLYYPRHVIYTMRCQFISGLLSDPTSVSLTLFSGHFLLSSWILHLYSSGLLHTDTLYLSSLETQSLSPAKTISNGADTSVYNHTATILDPPANLSLISFDYRLLSHIDISLLRSSTIASSESFKSDMDSLLLSPSPHGEQIELCTIFQRIIYHDYSSIGNTHTSPISSKHDNNSISYHWLRIIDYITTVFPHKTHHGCSDMCLCAPRLRLDIPSSQDPTLIHNIIMEYTHQQRAISNDKHIQQQNLQQQQQQHERRKNRHKRTSYGSYITSSSSLPPTSSLNRLVPPSLICIDRTVMFTSEYFSQIFIEICNILDSQCIKSRQGLYTLLYHHCNDLFFGQTAPQSTTDSHRPITSSSNQTIKTILPRQLSQSLSLLPRFEALLLLGLPLDNTPLPSSLQDTSVSIPSWIVSQSIIPQSLASSILPPFNPLQLIMIQFRNAIVNTIASLIDSLENCPREHQQQRQEQRSQPGGSHVVVLAGPYRPNSAATTSPSETPSDNNRIVDSTTDTFDPYPSFPTIPLTGRSENVPSGKNIPYGSYMMTPLSDTISVAHTTPYDYHHHHYPRIGHPGNISTTTTLNTTSLSYHNHTLANTNMSNNNHQHANDISISHYSPIYPHSILLLRHTASILLSHIRQMMYHMTILFLYKADYNRYATFYTDYYHDSRVSSTPSPSSSDSMQSIDFYSIMTILLKYIATYMHLTLLSSDNISNNDHHQQQQQQQQQQQRQFHNNNNNNDTENSIQTYIIDLKTLLYDILLHTSLYLPFSNNNSNNNNNNTIYNDYMMRYHDIYKNNIATTTSTLQYNDDIYPLDSVYVWIALLLSHTTTTQQHE